MNLKTKIFYLFLAAASIVSIIGSVVYRLYALNLFGAILTAILSLGGLCIFYKTLPKEEEGQEGLNHKKCLWSLPYLIFSIPSFYFLLSSRTGDALTSPWQVVPPLFFATYAMATAALFLAVKKDSFTGILTSIHYFLSFSALWTVFKYGYGYDPLIHQASLELIDKQGYIQPKQFLYLGQYSLEIVAHKLLFLPIDWLDKLLVPALAAITLPQAISLFLKKSVPNLSSVIHHLSFLSLLILPLSILTITVPQNLAYLFLILSLFIGLGQKDRIGTTLAGLLALAAFCCHPLAGIPAVIWVTALAAGRILRGRMRTVVRLLCLVGAATALPLALYVSQIGQGGGPQAPTPSGVSNLLWGLSRQENVILNFVHFFSYYQNVWISVIFLSALVFVFLKMRGNAEMTVAAGMALALLVSFFITKNFVDFGALISYERGDYLIRILTEAFLFILPAIAMLFSFTIRAIDGQSKFVKTAILLFAVLMVTASLYCSYPRKDNYFNSRSFSVSDSDFKAVEAVQADAGEESYVVLADQQVSAAALRTFGFGHYFKDYSGGSTGRLIYFYPIPTGGPLYGIYLDMVYNKADRETARKASELTGAKTVYFILNEYWWAFDKIKEEAKMDSDKSSSIEDGDIAIFKYSF